MGTHQSRACVVYTVCGEWRVDKRMLRESLFNHIASSIDTLSHHTPLSPRWCPPRGGRTFERSIRRDFPFLLPFAADAGAVLVFRHATLGEQLGNT